MNRIFELPNQNKNKIKFINLNNDSIIFLNSSNQIISSKGLMALINEEKIEALYSFNPDSRNFDAQKNELDFPYTLINYDNNSNFKRFFSDTLEKSDITKYFIYFLFFLVMIEMILSNAKPSKSN
jgi:superfamily I DNA/RNA helicase